MTKTQAMFALAAVLILAVGVTSYLTLKDHGDLKAYVHAESAQRVTTIGERCENTQRQVAEHGPQEAWFLASYKRCLKSLAKVEARAGVKYSSTGGNDEPAPTAENPSHP